eukprot:TRINITY_DN3523_c0_g1_i4.p1 TRINITY_DN3523_c0_g1~~TRINITY_DN3523_c0_g1_i4.p1  ORF type:complete len:259 (-),score=46.41 TRINITY_DN3523_c0_g1_i4:401-1177(-)
MSIDWKAFVVENAAHLIDLVVAIITFVLATPALDTIEPTHREFRLDDPDISYRNTEGTVPSWQLSMISFFIPSIIFIAIHFGYRFQDRKYTELFIRILGLFCAIALTAIITNTIKIATGRLRPDFLDRCQWDAQLMECTGNADDVRGGRKSFPSGHASYSFTGCTYLTIVFLHELQPYAQSNISRAPFTRLFLSIWPLIVAALVAVSRVTDNRHHPGDVIVGSILGVVVAVICYKLHHKNVDTIEPKHSTESIGNTAT